MKQDLPGDFFSHNPQTYVLFLHAQHFFGALIFHITNSFNHASIELCFITWLMSNWTGDIGTEALKCQA